MFVDLEFRPLAVIDIDAGSVPFDDVSVFITQRDLVVKHPTKFPVGPSHPGFMQEGLAADQRRTPLFHHCFEVVGMDCGCPLPALQILERPAHVRQPSLIEEIEVAIRQSGVDQRWGRVDDELNFRS